jgi:predicted nucleic acid-binding protein
VAAFLFDTDIVVDDIRGHRQMSAIASVGPQDRRMLSVVGLIELLQGAPNKPKQAEIGQIAATFEIIFLNDSICELAVALITEYSLSNGLRLGDALTAATALQYDLTLLTRNVRHYRAISGLKLEVPA